MFPKYNNMGICTLATSFTRLTTTEMRVTIEKKSVLSFTTHFHENNIPYNPTGLFHQFVIPMGVQLVNLPKHGRVTLVGALPDGALQIDRVEVNREIGFGGFFYQFTVSPGNFFEIYLNPFLLFIFF